jgi:hypothetical protein
VSARRFCRRGHELIVGETASIVERWTWCRIRYCRRLNGEAAHAADTTGNVRWNPAVGSETWPKPGAWEHRTFEIRCRVCNCERLSSRAQSRPGG